MQAQSGAAFVAARGEEWIESLALEVGRHDGPVIGADDLDIIRHARSRRDSDLAWSALRASEVDGLCQ